MNIVLIALDTQRADHLGCYGYHKDTSPFIDSIAKRGVLFEKCYAPNIPTHPSFSTMLTGKEAITHNIINIGGGVPIEPGVKMIQEVLKEKGFNTGAVDTMGRHFPRGFDTYISPEWDTSDPMSLRRAEHVTDNALPLIDKLKSGDKPFFLFLHYWDPHTPYLPPEPYREMFYEGSDPYDVNNHSMDKAWNDEAFKWYFHSWMPGVTDADYVNALFDAETRYMDEHLQRIFAALAEVQEDTLIILTADHGEVLNDHDGFYDHHGLYEANVHVPLIMYRPGTLPEGKRVSGLVQNLDFVPTWYEMLGLDDETGCEGKSLLPLIQGERDGNYEEIYLSEATWQVKRGAVNEEYKYIHALQQDQHGGPMRELYDLKADREEQHNIIDEKPEIAAQIEERLQAWLKKRLQETGRDADPAEVQGQCGTKIGSPVEGETPGAGATPLSQRSGVAAHIPSPEELNAGKDGETVTNTSVDENTGAPLHGYVDES